ncbi:efflux RND transporter periplasmic adaptor subunit [Pararhodobacter oceanensis]|uniref:efflux RND transporter periplasmic adaptor subunit n=1 Tax=Pararhodobacter oceanensis TaxID=2172121 RepID=UPI003A92C05B
MTRILLASLTLAIAALVASPDASLAQTPIVKIEAVGARGGGLSRVFFGHVVARETVDLSFQVGGQIVEFPLEEGADVPTGGLVARLDLVPFQLSLEQAQINSDQAARTLERYRRLEGGAVSPTTVQDAQTQAELADVGLRNAERALEQATLIAPFDALVASRLVPNYSTIGAGTPVVRLHDMSDIRIEIEVPETMFRLAGLTPDVEIFAEFTGDPRRYPLEIREVNAETAAVGQTYTITLGMDPADELDVWPGSSARVTATMIEPNPTITVPASAVVIGNDGGTSVMVFTPTGALEGRVTATAVELAASDRGEVEIISGLQIGQEIVTIGASQLRDGEDVRRFTGFGG